MNPKKRARILDKIRQGRATRMERLILKQEGLCFYCWTDLDKDVTKEHLDAKANGGSNEAHNLRAAHMLCNGIVGSLPVDLKLELHEIGRDRGAEAFWTKAREYQQKYGQEKKAYRRHKGSLQSVQRKITGVDRTTQAPREITPEEAERELAKLALGQQTLSKGMRGEAVAEETERRKQTGLPVQLGWRKWHQMMEQRLAEAKQAAQTEAA